MDTIRIGIIGAGKVVQGRHIPRLKAIPGVEMGLVWKRSLEEGEALANEHGFTRAVADWREIIDSPDIDALIIGTPPVLHRDATLAGLDAGKHVLCQARMARNLKEAQEMASAALKSDKITWLYPPAPGLKGDNTMKRLINEERFVGTVREVRMAAMTPPSGNDNYHWRYDPDVSGVHMLSMGMWIEVLNRWVGKTTSLSAQAQTYTSKVRSPSGGWLKSLVPESLVISAQLEVGGQLSYHLSTEAAFTGQNTIEIYGSKGALKYSLSDDAILGATSGMADFESVTPHPDEIRAHTTDAEFIAAIRGGPEVSPSFQEGLHYMEFCEAVAQAVHFGQVVPTPPEPLMATWGKPLD